MENSNGEELNAQMLVWKHTLSMLDSLLLKCAVDLEIAETIQKHGQPMTISQLGSSLPKPITNTDILRRIMRYLVHMKLFRFQAAETDDGEELFGTNLATQFLLKNHHKGIIPMFLFTMHLSNLQTLLALGSSIEGEAKTPPFQLVHGEGLWEHASKHPDYNKAFNESTACGAQRDIPALIDSCRDMFGEIGSLVDVGGGTGTAAQAIANAFPHIKCKVLDLPHVVATAPQDSEVEYVTGDMFSHIPNADAVMLMRILHNWNDEECLKILNRCKEAIPNGGRVIIVDLVIGSDEQEDMQHIKLAVDIMIFSFLSGKERTEKEWSRLLLKAGFSQCKIIHVNAMLSVIEAFP